MSEKPEITMNDVLRLLGTPGAVPDVAVETHRVLGGITKSRKDKRKGYIHTIQINSDMLTIREVAGIDPNTHRGILIIWDDAAVREAYANEPERQP